MSHIWTHMYVYNMNCAHAQCVQVTIDSDSNHFLAMPKNVYFVRQEHNSSSQEYRWRMLDFNICVCDCFTGIDQKQPWKREEKRFYDMHVTDLSDDIWIYLDECVYLCSLNAMDYGKAFFFCRVFLCVSIVFCSVASHEPFDCDSSAWQNVPRDFNDSQFVVRLFAFAPVR